MFRTGQTGIDRPSSQTNIFCVVRILRCERWPSEDALLLIRQTNFVTLLSAFKNVLRGELWRSQETGHGTNHQYK